MPRIGARHRPRLRVVLSLLASLVVGGMLAMGLSAPAFASGGFNFTVHVTSTSGAALSGVGVYAYQVAGGEEVPGAPVPKAVAVAHKPGYYLFSGTAQLLSGLTYTLAFYPPTGSTSSTFIQLLGDTAYFDRAQTFTVDAQHTSMSMSLATNAKITGKVTGPTGKVMSGATILSYNFNGSYWYADSSIRANSKGVYTLTDLDPGSYKLEFYSPTGAYAPVFSGGAATLDAATALPIALDTTTTVNAAFPKNTGSIVGSSSADYEGLGDFPLASATPAAYPVTSVDAFGRPTAVDFDRAVYGSRSNSRGSWGIGGLAPGEYVVQLLPYYYNESAGYIGTDEGQPELINAAVFSVTTGVVSAGWSEFYTASRGGSVTFTVVNAANLPVAGANVLLQRTSDTDEYYQGVTSAAGTITFGRYKKTSVIQPGAFTLSILSANNTYEPVTEEYDLWPGELTQTVQLSPLMAEPGFSVAPAIAQTATDVGTIYTVTTTAARADATLYYEWMRNGHPIYGADGASYQSRSADLGDQLSVRVTASSFGFDDVFASASVLGVVTTTNAVPLLVTPPSISPSDGTTVHPGTTLYTSPGTWSIAGLSFSYTWFDDGVQIQDGSSNQYVATADDIGHQISAQVTATRVGYPDAVPATATNVVVPTPGPATAPVAPLVVTSTAEGVPKGFLLYTVAPGEWTGLDPSFSYTWTLGGVPVGTDEPTFLAPLSAAALSEPMAVEVDAVVAGFGPGSITQLVRKGSPKLIAASAPIVTLGGGAVTATTPVSVGLTLTAASPGTWLQGAADVGDLTFSYQWMRATGTAAARAIIGATAASYSPAAADVGMRLSLVVTAHSTLWGDGVSVRVAAGSAVASAALKLPLPDLTISGTDVPGDLLTASLSDEWAAIAPTTAYQWYLCSRPSCIATSPVTKFVKIAHATTPTYIPTTAEGGDRMFVVATATRPGYLTAQASSAIATVLATNFPMPVLSRPTIDTQSSSDGMVHVGHDVYGYGAELGPSAPETVTSAETWQVCSNECDSSTATWTTADGTVGGFGYFTPDVSDWSNGNGYLRLLETISAPEYATVSVASDPWPIETGTYQLSDAQLPSFNLTDTSIWSSTIYTVEAPAVTEGTPTVQWYLGAEELPGVSQTIDSAFQEGIPEYAVVSYAIPGYAAFTMILVARYGLESSLTPSPNTIVGDAFGQTLTLSQPAPYSLPDLPGAPWQFSYVWTVGDESFSTNDPSFTPTSRMIGQEISVQVSYGSPVYAGTYLQEVAGPTLQAGAAFDPATSPQLSWSGDLVAGTTITVSTPTYAIAGVVTTYAWQLSSDGGSTWTDVAGDTTDSYTPTLTEAGEQVRAIVSGTEDGYPDSVHDSETEQIQIGDIIRELAAPTISGSGAVNGALTLDTGAWSHDVTLHIQWLLNGTAIPGATTTSYTPLAMDYGDEISASVTATRSGELDLVAESNRMTIGEAAAPVAMTAPVITVASGVYTVSTGGWSASGLVYSYQWQVAGVDATGAGATDESYTRLPSDAGVLSVVITATRFGYADGSATVTGPTLVAAL